MKIAFGIFIILLGVIILFFNPGWGLLERIFENFATAWPMILIFLGLAILSQVKRLRWLKILNTILMVLFIVYLLLWPDLLNFGNLNLYKSGIDLPIDVPVGSTVKLIFLTSSLNLKINDGESSTSLIGYYSFNSKYFEVISRENEFIFQSSKGFNLGRKNEIELNLPENYKYEIIIKSGTSGLKFDLKRVMMEKLEIESGIASLNMKLKRLAFPTSIKIKAGITNANIEFPESTKYSLDFDGAIRNVKISNLIEEKESPDVVLIGESGILNLKLVGKD
ncbi:MAG TPA: hypothetical protein ENF81_00640 [Thermotogaceae bacterium]|nr:hypothetical protein [Thermotogaceae bacterium]